MRRIIPLLVALLIFVIPVQAHDHIPDNCETATSADVRNLIARFEANHSRLVLADWRTGATVRVLGEGLAGYRIRAWSPDCRYLAIAEGDWRSTDTVVYDAENSVRMGSVPDAALKLHPITWGPDGYLIVESRRGALLWHVPSGRQSILTESFNYTRVRNFVQIVWDIPQNQVLVTLALGGRAAFDLGTGVEIPLTEEAHALLDADKIEANSANTSEDLINVDLRVEESFTGSYSIGVPIPLVARITNIVYYDLKGELTATIDVPDIFGISDIRIDPAQDYTRIQSVVNSVRADGETRTITLHDPDRLLTIEHITDNEDQPLTRLTWVFTEGLIVADGGSLEIDFRVVPREKGVFDIHVDAVIIHENEE